MPDEQAWLSERQAHYATERDEHKRLQCLVEHARDLIEVDAFFGHAQFVICDDDKDRKKASQIAFPIRKPINAKVRSDRVERNFDDLPTMAEPTFVSRTIPNTGQR